jgi:hypothetical protein
LVKVGSVAGPHQLDAAPDPEKKIVAAIQPPTAQAPSNCSVVQVNFLMNPSLFLKA